MKFKGNGIAWDAIKDRVLCKFIDGQFETEDNQLIDDLKKNGYVLEDEPKKKAIKSKGAE